jgi:class 3 adenylate cyclase
MVERTERRLTAIRATDVVGYSRLMGVDEEGTLTRLKLHRSELLDPKITEYRGRIVKTIGDGELVEFVSFVNAVHCAMEIQRGMVARNVAVAPDRRIEFRIGINVGDIIVEGGDIYGDGVNVAARLEGLAEPGGFASRAECRKMRMEKSTWSSRMQVSSNSRPSYVRYGSSEFGWARAPRNHRLHPRFPTSRRLPYFRSKIRVAIWNRITSPMG